MSTHNLRVQTAYFLAWPVLGTGVILGVTPSDEQLMQVMHLQGRGQLFAM